jgi:hypothetical protein
LSIECDSLLVLLSAARNDSSSHTRSSIVHNLRNAPAATVGDPHEVRRNGCIRNDLSGIIKAKTAGKKENASAVVATVSSLDGSVAPLFVTHIWLNESVAIDKGPNVSFPLEGTTTVPEPSRASTVFTPRFNTQSFPVASKKSPPGPLSVLPAK